MGEGTGKLEWGKTSMLIYLVDLGQDGLLEFLSIKCDNGCGQSDASMKSWHFRLRPSCDRSINQSIGYPQSFMGIDRSRYGQLIIPCVGHNSMFDSPAYRLPRAKWKDCLPPCLVSIWYSCSPVHSAFLISFLLNQLIGTFEPVTLYTILYTHA